ncbi:MAG: HAMP domain-containing protein [Telmatospirillum sp.]|nr:HAMP domain-containing protein [Telmatospirillum sp.]
MGVKLKLATLANILGFLVIVGFAATVLTSDTALRKLKVGGPVYERIVLGKDLVADILPPPAYVLEAYLEATLAMQPGSEVAAHKQALTKLKSDYDTRQAFWRDPTTDIEADVRRKLTVDAHQPGLEFWKIIDEQLVPALEADDRQRAQTVYSDLQAAYARHRAGIDAAVSATEKMNETTEAYAAAQEGRFMLVLWLVSGFVMLVAIVGVGGVILGMIRPIRTMTGAMRALADGDTTLEIPARGRADEIGEMAKAVQVFKDNALENERLKSQQSVARAEAEAAKKAAMRGMAETVERETGAAVETISRNTRAADSAADGMTRLAQEVSSDSQAVAAASEQALVNVQTVSSAAEELTASIGEISAQIARASSVTKQAVASGDNARATIQSLSDAVAKISEVTKLIGQIAGQTNLLALNATIEAARAGDAGKGFAVVASEVKNLANQTGRSTEDIDRQVGEIQAATKDAVAAVMEIGERIREVDEVANAIAAAMEEQGAATQEIARNVGQTAEASREVAAKIARVSAQAGSVETSAADVRAAVASVTDEIASLRDTLVRVVRTSTIEADRRGYPRYAIAAGVEVSDGSGKRIEATLVDSSEHGACLRTDAKIRVGGQGTMRLEGLSSALRFVVRETEADKLHVEFEPVEQAYVDWFARKHIGLKVL